MFSFVYTRWFFNRWRNLLVWCDSVATNSCQRETRPRTDQERGAETSPIDCVRTLALPWHTVSHDMSKRLASIVRRSPCYPFHGSPRDSFVRGNPLLTKFNIPGGSIRSGTASEGRAIQESACVLSAEFLTSRRKFFRNWSAPPVFDAVRWTFRQKCRARENRLRGCELSTLSLLNL